MRARQIVAVQHYAATDLTPENTHQPEGTDMRRFVEELRANYYPHMPNNAALQVVTFTLETEKPEELLGHH